MEDYDRKQFYKELGRRLREIRKGHCESQQQLGDFLGVTLQQIQKYERGVNRLPIDSACRICHRYDLPIERLLPPSAMPTGPRTLLAETLLEEERFTSLLHLWHGLPDETKTAMIDFLGSLPCPVSSDSL